MEQTNVEVQERQVKVSVLVAVYNGERFLRKCLDSLLRQTLRDIEVICIDDASTDGSLEILREYAEKDERVVVMHLDENKGQAHARNRGLEKARGEYVCMLDCDDWMSDDALASAVEVFEANADTDSVLFDLILVDEATKKEERFKLTGPAVLSGKEAFRKSLEWDGIHGVYMTRTELHRRYPYDETSMLYSDDNTTRIHFFFSREVRFCSGKYFYLQHSSSMTHAVGARRFLVMRALKSLKNDIIQITGDKEVIDSLENTIWLKTIDSYFFYYTHRGELSVDDLRFGLEEIKTAWREVETDRLDRHTTRKFGYVPLRPWVLFRLQEEMYFTLKKCKNVWEKVKS
ncbi:MAG: glycosyltransferase family 2 protein [Prevotella sp.]|nr:glycosyltransferase family 2 protein [Prevotella sp.]